MGFPKYKLTDTQVTKIARLCNQEQGTIAGARAEASLMANQLETSPWRQDHYGTGAEGLYNWIRNGGWFYRAAYYMDHGSASAAQISAVREVLCDAKRTLPQYIDEHDCISDISYIKVNGTKYSSDSALKNHQNYIKNVTIVHNDMGSTWTFYEFPAIGSDPFGYTKEAYDYVMKHGGDVDPVADPVADEVRVKISANLPQISEGSEGMAVRIWQAIIGVGVDGDFGSKTHEATKKWQNARGLSGDGIVGKNTWTKALKKVK